MTRTARRRRRPADVDPPHAVTATVRDPTLSAGTRVLLAVFAPLALLEANQLYVLSTTTDRGFAWTVQPALTAAFLGAGYGAGVVLTVLSRRAGRWAEARIGYHTVLLFTLLTLAATLLHLDRFHLAADDTAPRTAAWAWVIVYVLVPPAMAAALRWQGRADPSPAGRPLGGGLTIALAVQGTALVGVGTALWTSHRLRSLWPWDLTPLTARAVGSWLVALGLAAALTLRDRDLDHLRAPAVTYATFGALQLGALLRFPDQLVWHRPSAWIYAVGVSSILVVGLVGVWRAAGHSSNRRQPDTMPNTAAAAARRRKVPIRGSSHSS